jgi:methyltransferase
VAVQRLVELAVSRRNERRLLARGGERLAQDGFLPLAAAHALLYVALPLEWAWAPWAGLGLHSVPALALALAASAWRYWAALSLGPRYTVHVIRLPGSPLVHRGPYRWMRHPIYRAVAVELPAVPLAFGAIATALLLFAAQGLALVHRIRVEERHLGLA